MMHLHNVQYVYNTPTRWGSFQQNFISRESSAYASWTPQHAPHAEHRFFLGLHCIISKDTIRRHLPGVCYPKSEYQPIYARQSALTARQVMGCPPFPSCQSYGEKNFFIFFETNEPFSECYYQRTHCRLASTMNGRYKRI